MIDKSTASVRLATVLKGEQADRLPCICPGGMMNMLTAELMELAHAYWPDAHTDPAIMAKLASATYTNGLFDNIGVPFCMTVEAEAMGAKTDLGDLYTEPRVTEYAISSLDRWEELKPLDLAAGRVKTVLDAIALIKQDHPEAAIIGNLTGPISTASSAADANYFYRDLRKKKEAAHAMIDFVTDQLVAFGKAQIAAGAEFIAISDPSGTGEILGPKLFEEYALPALNRLCRELKPLCKGVIVHICGQLKPIYPQLKMLECSSLSVDAIVSVKALKEALPSMPVMGNVSTFALAGGDESVIRKLCRSCISNGVDILAPACGLGTTTTVESIRLMMSSVKSIAEESENA